MKEPAEACASAASEFAYAFDRLETRHHLLDRNLRFHAGQRISRASVNAAAECQVPVGISPDVEAARIRKLGRSSSSDRRSPASDLPEISLASMRVDNISRSSCVLFCCRRAMRFFR